MSHKLSENLKRLGIITERIQNIIKPYLIALMSSFHAVDSSPSVEALLYQMLSLIVLFLAPNNENSQNVKVWSTC